MDDSNDFTEQFSEMLPKVSSEQQKSSFCGGDPLNTVNLTVYNTTNHQFK